MPVIYLVTNLENGHVYVGKTVDFSRRKREHLNALRKGVHNNKHLQSAFNKYGEDRFMFEVLEECKKEELEEREIYWLNQFGGFQSDENYNQCEGGKGGIFTEEVLSRLRGWHHSEESKEKMSISRRGLKLNLSDSQRRAIAERSKVNLTGRKHSSDSKKKMSETLKESYKSKTDTWGMSNKHHTDETRTRISQSEKGKIVSEETRLKISMAKKNPSEETRKKMRESHLGKKVSEETKKKTSESLKKHYELKKENLL